MADSCGFDFILSSNYFKACTLEKQRLSVCSELPDGESWVLKWMRNTGIYTLVISAANAILLINQMIAKLAIEFNLYTSDELLSTVWEPSVGLPDTRAPIPTDICERKRRVKERLGKSITVTLQEFQDKLNTYYAGFGIWLATGATGLSFRYTFNYTFQHGSIRERLTIDVHIPWFAIDPNDVENSPLRWENIKSFLYSFAPAYIYFNPIYEAQESKCIIINPQDLQSVYTNKTDGAWSTIPVQWLKIDTIGTATIVNDTELIEPSTTQITRSFVDSTSATIGKSIDINVIPLL